MVRIYFYDLKVEFISVSHLHNQKFFEKVDNDIDADFLFVSITNQLPFFQRITVNKNLLNKKIILYNFTEPISFGGAKAFYQNCLKNGILSRNIFFHSTNHFLDRFNCLHNGLSITDHSEHSQLNTGFKDYSERFLKFYFTNNAIRKPRALVLNELLNRNLNFNQSYVSCNGEEHYGNRHIENFPNIKNNLDILQSHDHSSVFTYTNRTADFNFQSVYKNSFFGFTIETFSDFGFDNNGFNSHLTEKTLRNFAHKIPFLLLISSEEQIKIIEELGFVLFNDLFSFKIDLNDTQTTVKSYVDVIEMFSKMKSSDVMKLCTSDEFKKRIEHNYIQYSYYRNLDIENIYRYILLDTYEDKNLELTTLKENDEIVYLNILSTQI